MEFDELPDDGETESEATVLPAQASLALAERIEDVADDGRIDSCTSVLHAKHRRVAFDRNRDVDLSFRRRELDRIGQQVRRDLLEAALIAGDERWSGLHSEFDLLPRDRLAQRIRRGNDN